MTKAKAVISEIQYCLPERVLTNAELSAQFPEWAIETIEGKTGVRQRHIAMPGECASDLAERAAQKLFASGKAHPAEIDMVLLCTQTPDHLLPTTACLLQHRLGIPTTAGALDFNLGCSGFVYGLGLAKGLIESGQAKKVLLLTADTYSKLLDESDRSVRSLFGDGAAATLIEAVPLVGERAGSIEPVVYGTDGRGGPNLIVPDGMRCPDNGGPFSARDGRNPKHLFMDGREIFNFTTRVVPALVGDVLRRTRMTMEEIDLFVFHQASRLVLEHLRKKIGVAPEKFYIGIEDCGNTVSSTIPMALKRAAQSGTTAPGDSVLLAGFGVGYSWAGTVVSMPALGPDRS